MRSLRKPTKERIDQWLEEQQDRKLNYAEICATRSESLPSGYQIDRHTVELGHGAAAYERAVAAIRGLRMWDFPWLQLCWPTTPVQVGSVLATLTWQLGLWYLNGCRIVYLVDENESQRRRFGFAFGTLAGHVEQGEERFTVEWRTEDDSVWYEILSFSRPAHWLLKVGYPYARWLQKCFARDSLQAVAKAVKESVEVNTLG
jgi:uncharacterized protein (UPF0548 family)